MKQLDVVAIVGSLRRESFTRRTVLALQELSPPELTIEIVEIGDLPFYNQDLETTPAPQWVTFRERVKRCDGVLFATPEYNRSIPGVLKNAIDVGSRPYGQSAWSGKPAAVISVSPGAVGAFGANHHLRQCLVFLDMPAMAQPEAYIGGIDKLLDASHQIVKPETREFLQKYLRAFATWIGRNGKRAEGS